MLTYPQISEGAIKPSFAIMLSAQILESSLLHQILVRPGAPRTHRTLMHPRCLHPLPRACSFPLCSSPSLLQQVIPPLVQDTILPLFHACQPVAETATCGCVDRVHPEGLFVEERTHFDAQLPEADGDAYGRISVSIYSVEEFGEGTEARPEEYFVDHCGCGA